MTGLAEPIPSQITTNIEEVLGKYDLAQASIGMIASHSALDLADGAKDENFDTLAICERGREKTYSRYHRIITETILLDRFRDLLNPSIQQKLRNHNVLFVPNRSLTAYVPVDRLEN